MAEQRRIAGALRTIQEAIAAQEDVIAAARELKRSLMERLFAYSPGRELTSTKETEIGQIPGHWEVIRLDEMLRERIRNGAFVKRKRFGSGVPFLNVADTYDNVSIRHHRWERVEATEDELETYGLQPGDLFFVRSSLNREGVGQCCVVEDVPVPAIYDCHLMRVRVDEANVLPKFLTYFSRSPQGREALVRRSKTTTMTTINQEGLREFRLPVPPVHEQRAIIQSLEAIDHKIAAEEQRELTLKELFRSSLEHLMTGQIRLGMKEVAESWSRGMTNLLIFGTQIVTALGYIVALFALYRLLVSQKDATIESLEHRIDLLKDQLDVAKEQSPSVLAQRLTKRVEMLEEELDRLSQDQDENGELIIERETELAEARQKIKRFRRELEAAERTLSEYKCPFCGAFLSAKEYHVETLEYEGRALDLEHELVRYRCGFEIVDGDVSHPCPAA